MCKSLFSAASRVMSHANDSVGHEAAVVGVPDEYARELPRAYVVLKPEVAAAVQNKLQPAAGGAGEDENCTS